MNIQPISKRIMLEPGEVKKLNIRGANIYKAGLNDKYIIADKNGISMGIPLSDCTTPNLISIAREQIEYQNNLT